MPSTCPRGCCRLACGAVFMSVGVIQFLVGMILLRSKYVYLIAGPDFWTSASNIAVGCLLGISASVWKQSRKCESKKHIVRRHLLLALLFSGLTINATTLGILLIGKDNALLSIRLESDDEHSKRTFASEVLAYAYVTSVCCPVICVVVSIVAISGSCFSSAKRNSITKKLSLNSPKKSRLQSLQWIYNHDLAKTKYQEPDFSTSESSSDDYDENSTDLTLPSKYESSADDLQNVLTRMAQGKRDSILKDSTVMLRQLDLRRKNKYNSLNLNESYMGPVLSRVKEYVVPGERHARPSITDYNNSKTGNSKLYFSEIGDNARLTSEDRSAKHIYHSSAKRHNIQHRNAHEKFVEHQTDSLAFVENPPMQYRTSKDKPHARPKVTDNALGYSLDVTDYTPKSNAAAIHKRSRKLVDIEDQYYGEKSIVKKPSHGKKRNESLKDHQVINEEKIKQFNEVNKYEGTLDVIDDCLSTDGSDFSPDGIELSKKNSPWAGEIVPIKIKSTSLPRLSCKLIPVPSPVVPGIQSERGHPKISDDSGISSIQSNSFSSEFPNQTEFKDRENNMSSFRENPKKIKENMLEYPKPGSPIVKKYDLSKVVKMASISEEPNAETNSLEQKAHCSSFNETTPSKWKSSKQKSLPIVLSGSSKETGQDKENSGMNDTPRRKRSASGKALRKLWSLAGPENHIDFLDQVVDDDSLIGLSEEELIARQLRYRSIRKAVQQRLKGEMTVMIENCSEV